MLGIGPFGRIGVGVVAGFWTWDGEVEEWESGRLVFVGLIGWAVAIIAVVSSSCSFRLSLALSTSLPSLLPLKHTLRISRSERIDELSC